MTALSPASPCPGIYIWWLAGPVRSWPMSPGWGEWSHWVCPEMVTNAFYHRKKYDIFWPDLERWEKSLEWISSHDEALGIFQERLFSSSQQRWQVLSWHNMDGRLPVDRDIVHLEEVGGPGARPDLNQTSRFIVTWKLLSWISPCNFHSTLCGASRQI